MTSKQEPRTNGPKLKPCPFCGGDAYFDRLGTPRVSAIVACGDCGCRMESSDTGENSGRTWNQREPSHPQEATGLQCEKDGVCALVSRNDDEWHCTACNGDFVRKQPVEPLPAEATGGYLSGWVIEGAWSPVDRPEYWAGSSIWSADAYKALRFATRESAQQSADLMCAGMNVRIAYHEFAEE